MRPARRATFALAVMLVSILVSELAGPGPSSTARAAYPGSNGRIAVASVHAGDSSYQIYTMSSDGSGQTRLTTEGNNQWPAWSADGSRIAFARYFENAPTGDRQIYVMRADGSGQTQLTTNGDNIQPAWSPDGSQIAFTSSRDGQNGGVYLMKADGSGQTRLTSAIFAASPAWSPDGTKIAFESLSEQGGTHIFVMKPDGSGRTQLTSLGSSFAPSWSPDGSRIAFASVRGTEPLPQIYVMQSDGSNQVQLTASGNNQEPVWSPDGAQIAFESYPGGNEHLFRMQADGSHISQVTNQASFQPDWQAGPVGGTPTQAPTQTLTATLTLTATPTPTSTPAPTGPNLIQNPSFEDVRPGGAPTVWQPRPTAFRDTTVHRTGAASLRLEGPSAGDTTVYTFQTLMLQAGRTYRLTAWVRTQNVTGRGVRVRYDELQPVARVFDSETRNGTVDWTQLTSTVVLPSTFVSGRVDVYWNMRPGDRAWVDDVSLVCLTCP